MSTAQMIFSEVKDLPEQQAQEVLDFVAFLKSRLVKEQTVTDLSIAQYAGMVKLPVTGQKRNLDDFDAAHFVQGK